MVSPFNILIDRSDGHTWMTKFSIHEVEKDDAYDSAVTKLNDSEQNQIRLVFDQWLKDRISLLVRVEEGQLEAGMIPVDIRVSHDIQNVNIFLAGKAFKAVWDIKISAEMIKSRPFTYAISRIKILNRQLKQQQYDPNTEQRLKR